MKAKWLCFHVIVVALAIAAYLPGSSFAEDAKRSSRAWQEQAVEYARIMSRVKWTPVASGMPNRRGGYFEEGTEYTGVPYSSVKAVGRCIGFDIYLKTFLAAVENPHSVLYTENGRQPPETSCATPPTSIPISHPEAEGCIGSPTSMPGASATRRSRSCFRTTTRIPRRLPSIVFCCSIAETGFPITKTRP
jgi:hypothetical protein